MSKRRSLFLGLGCGFLLIAVLVVVVGVASLRGPGLAEEMVVALRLTGSLPELAAEDPFAEILGEQQLDLRTVRDALVRAAEDDRVKGVRVRIDAFGGGLATAQEIRSLLLRVKASGKWTAAYMDTAGEFQPGNMVYWIASACDEISVNPMGDVNLLGFSVRSPFIRGSLDKLGVRPEFPGRGRYKTARFMYTNKDFTPAHREMMGWLVSSLSDQIVSDIGAGRGLEESVVRSLINNGPYIGQEAVDADLIDFREDWTSFTTRLSERDPAADNVYGVVTYTKRAKAMSTGPKIAVVTAVGSIMRGDSHKSMNPIFGGEVMGAETIARAWRDVRKARGVRAVVFRIDSGGGSAVASEIIRAEMERTAREMPVVVSMANVAGSGGYWITCGASSLVANPATITGSIGVYAGHLNLQEFWNERLGVSFGRIDFADNANFYGELEDWSDGQRQVADRLLDRIYDEFLDRVSKARGPSPEEIHLIGEGRVFTGQQALDNGLVDVLGGFDVAVLEAKRQAGLADDVRVQLVDYPKVLPWWQQMLEKKKEQEVALDEAVAQLNQAWQTGVLQTPGAVWMPPLYIE